MATRGFLQSAILFRGSGVRPAGLWGNHESPLFGFTELGQCQFFNGDIPAQNLEAGNSKIKTALVQGMRIIHPFGNVDILYYNGPSTLTDQQDLEIQPVTTIVCRFR